MRLIWLDLVNRAKKIIKIVNMLLMFHTWHLKMKQQLRRSKADISDLISPLPCSIKPNTAVSSPQLTARRALTSHYLIFKVEKTLQWGARICHIGKRLFCASNCSLEILEEPTHMAQICAPALVPPLLVRHVDRGLLPAPFFSKELLS